LRSKRLSITLLLLLMPLTIAFAWGRTESKTTDTQGQESCTWQFAEAKEYLSKEGDGFSTSRSGNSIQTSYTYPGNLDCKDQVFQTTHTWTDPGSSLTPGQELTFDVSASWNLDGSAQCSSMVTGVNTWVMAGVTTIEAKNSHINVSTEPNGSISKQGSWVVPFGGNPGQEMTITAHAEQAGAGGSINYIYQWVCQPETDGDNTAVTETPEASPTPGSDYRVLISTDSRMNPLLFTLKLEQRINGAFQPVPGAAMRVSALGYEGNETRLADEFLAPACLNCEYRDTSAYRLAHLSDPSQPIIVLTDGNGQAKITFFLDFIRLIPVFPQRDAPITIPIAVEYLGDGDGESILAEADFSASLESIGVVTAITYQQAQMYDAGGRTHPRNSGPLESYYDDPGTRDGTRTLSQSRRVLYDYPGFAGIGPAGSTPGTTLSTGQMLHVGDRVKINACDMVTNRMVNGLPAGAPGVIWVKVRFFDGTIGRMGVNGSVCTSTITFGKSPGTSGFLKDSGRFIYWSGGQLVDAVIGYYILPYEIISGITTKASLLGNFLSWASGVETPGWDAVYIQVKSELAVTFDAQGVMHVSTREGEPLLYTPATNPDGVLIPAGQTGLLAADGLDVVVQTTDTETALQVDALLAGLLDTTDEIDINAISEQPGNSIFSTIPRNTLILVGALCCLVLMAGVIILGGLTILLVRRRNRK